MNGNQLNLGDSAVQTTVTEADDPPLVGAELDRAPRGSESHVKDLRPLRLGTLRLPATRGELTLRATNVPGNGVIDVRAVALTLLS